MPEAPAETTPDPTPVAPVFQAPEAPEAAPVPKEPPAKPVEAGSGLPDDPTELKKMISDLRRENAKKRTEPQDAAKQARDDLAQTIGKALGLVNDEPVDPAELTKQLTASQAQAQQAALELAIFRSAPDASVASALLDSRSFLAKIADLDPTNAEAITAAVAEAVENIPALGKRTPAPNPAQGSSASGPSSASQLTKQDVERLAKEGKHEEIVKAKQDGRLNELLGIK